MEVRLRNGSKEYTLQREGSQKISRNGSKDYPVPLQRENSHRNISMLTKVRRQIPGGPCIIPEKNFPKVGIILQNKCALFPGNSLIFQKFRT